MEYLSKIYLNLLIKKDDDYDEEQDQDKCAKRSDIGYYVCFLVCLFFFYYSF